MTDKLEKHLQELENEGELLIKSGKELLKSYNAVTEYVLFCMAIMNRTININRGYITLIKDSNYIAAAPMVRLNLDSLLRLFASIQSEFDNETFAQKVRNGTKIKDIKDFKGKKKLTDFELVERLKKIQGFKWVKDIYDIGSGFVHLSNQHIYASLKNDDESLINGIRKSDEFVSDIEKEASTYYMIQSTKGINIFINDWIENMK